MNQIIRTALFALAVTGVSPVLADALSTSVMRPTKLDSAQGTVTGELPGGTGSRSFYVAAELAQGDLLSELIVDGRADTKKVLTLELLGADARPKSSHYVMTGLEARASATRSFPIDSAGSHVLRIIVEGPETGTYCVHLGGSALPSAEPAECFGAKAANATPPPPPQPPVKAKAPELPNTIEVIESTCEQRLRIGSEVLFDFDRYVVRPEARETLDAIANVVSDKAKPVTIEGHTDSKGTDSYNQALSERRAQAVEAEIRQRIAPRIETIVHGLGESKAVAPNELPDGSDNPDGRQRNRRVEVVINTCI